MRKVLVLLVLSLVTMFILAPAAMAVGSQTGTRIVIAKDQVVDDDLVLTGERIVIDGTVHGDVYAFGNTVTVTGTIDGNLVAFANNVEVQGLVKGSTFTAGNQIYVSGQVERSLVAAGSSVRLDQKATVGRSLITAGDQLVQAGSVARGMLIAGARVNISGQVGGDITGWVDRLQIEAPAKIQGSLTYTSQQDAVIAPGAKLGAVTRQLPPDWTTQQRAWYLSPWLIGLKFGGFLLIGLLTLALFPGLRRSFPQLITQKPWQAPLTGIAVLIGVPIAAVIVMITIIGLPLGFITLMAYPLAIYVGQILVSWSVGKLIAERVSRLSDVSWPLLFLGGALLTTLVTQIPWVHGIFGFAFLIYGLGGLALTIWSRRKQPIQA
jgi:cytoskeletal protein CcmA (bactofilin family)